VYYCFYISNSTQSEFLIREVTTFDNMNIKIDFPIVFRLLSINKCDTVYKGAFTRSPRLINAVESTKVNRVNSSFQWKRSTGLTVEQVGDGQLSFNVFDTLWVTDHRLPVQTSKSRPDPSVQRVVLVCV
jgi:hypothetical protein